MVRTIALTHRCLLAGLFSRNYLTVGPRRRREVSTTEESKVTTLRQSGLSHAPEKECSPERGKKKKKKERPPKKKVPRGETHIIKRECSIGDV